MSESPDKAEHAGLPWWTLAAAALLIAYPLCIGPAHWLCTRGIISENTLFTLGETMYYPPALLCENCETAAVWIDWYCGLFFP